MDVGGVACFVNGLPATIIFENEYARTDQFGNVVIETSAPQVNIPTHTAEALGVAHGSEVLTPDDKTWIVKEISPDGLGMTELRLVEKA